MFDNILAFFYCALLSAWVLTALLIAKPKFLPGLANHYRPEPPVYLCQFRDNYRISFLLSIVLFSTIMYFSVIGQPITAWDARSIWFFHAKMMYFSQKIPPFSGWSSDLDFAHQDYPNLFPLLASQVAAIAGYWNEYAPLTALLILSFVEIFSIFYLGGPLVATSILASFYLYFLLFPMKHPEDTPLAIYTNGYMDLHLALMGLAVVLAMWRTRGNLKLPESLLVILLVSMIASLKNEGLILAIMILVGLGVVQLLDKGQNLYNCWIRLSVFAGIALAPAVAWRFLLHARHIPNDLISPTWGPFRDQGLLSRFWMRANIESLSQIAYAMQVQVLVVLYLATVIIYVVRRRQANLETMFLFAHVPLLYYGFMALVFMIVPQDLKWWLPDTADRVILPTVAMLLASIGALCVQPPYLNDRR
jgi:hypothetical protein